MPIGATFRSARYRAFERPLAEAGFVEGKHLWVRSRGDQIHAVGLQTHQGQYAINLAFHYSFLPSFEEFDVLPPEELHELGFMLRTRLSSVLTGYDRWCDMEAPRSVLEAEMGQCAADSLRVLDECSQSWADPGWFLEHIPPIVLESETPVPGGKSVSCPTGGVPMVWSVVRGWAPEIFAMGYALSIFALRHGDRALAKQYAEIAAKERQDIFSAPAIEKLLQTLA